MLPVDVQLPPRCDGCAFTAGTAANRSELTRLKAQLCARLPEEFYCHDYVPVPGDTMALCRGWAEAVQALSRQGYYPQPEWRQGVIRACLAAIGAAEEYMQAHGTADGFDWPVEFRAMLEQEGLPVCSPPSPVAPRRSEETANAVVAAVAAYRAGEEAG